MYTVYHVMSLDDLALCRAEKTARHERDSHPWLYALPLEGLWQKDSSIDQGRCLLDGFQRERKFPAVTDCEKTTKQLVGGHRRNKRHDV